MTRLPPSSTCIIPDIASVPHHIAVIMDGNGRWAKQRFMPRVAGHQRGVEALREVVIACRELGVEYLTVFAFSSENWRRPADEVSFLMSLFLRMLEREVAKLHQNNIRLKIIGDRSRFNDKLRQTMQDAEQLTANNTALTLTIAANYGGRWDVMHAVQTMLKEHPHLAQTFTEADLQPYLSMSDAPEPDLFIRTGGEQRISNFMLWQLAYTELYFTDVLWPAFGRKELEAAIASYQKRERRFGRTSEQLLDNSHGKIRMLKSRVITAVILLALLLTALFALPLAAWAVLIVVMVMQGAVEWSRLSGFTGGKARLYWGITLLLMAGLLWMDAGTTGAQHVYTHLLVYAAAALLWLIVVPTWLMVGWKVRQPVLMALVGWAVLVPTGLAMLDLRAASPWILLFVMCLVWIADIAAYFTGRKFGKNKLAPSISPGKTWEGVAGALLGVSVYVVLVWSFSPEFAYREVLPILLLAAWWWVGLAVIGDLFESAIKRQAGVKDSGALLPGHGGLLDRIDALTSTLPLAALALLLQKLG